jgi:phospholipid-binding lipoprotein MlaA
MRPLWKTAIAFLTMVFVTGCASGPQASGHDPFEGFNRRVFAFNQRFDDHIAVPATKAYQRTVPSGIRASLHHFLDLLGTPVDFFNDVGQGEFTFAGTALCRMALNATGGLAGLGDPASAAGCPEHDEDFGQTLAVWGAPEGPYLVLPLMGPSSPRALAGRAGDVAMNPFSYAAYPGSHAIHWVRYGAGTMDQAQQLSTLRGIERESLDAYATERSHYEQHHAHEIANGREDPPALP